MLPIPLSFFKNKAAAREHSRTTMMATCLLRQEPVHALRLLEHVPEAGAESGWVGTGSGDHAAAARVLETQCGLAGGQRQSRSETPAPRVTRFGRGCPHVLFITLDGRPLSTLVRMGAVFISWHCHPPDLRFYPER